MAPKVFIVTGIPGTGVAESLERIRRRLPNVRVVSLEREFLCPLAAPYLREKYPLRGNHIMHIITLPQELLENLWRQSIGEIVAAISCLEEQTTVLLTFHASYYNVLKKGYVSLVDFKALRDSFDRIGAIPSGVITFIDDIFDCQQRICSARPRRLFDPPDSLRDSLGQLSRILDWRHQEILLSRLVASQCRELTQHIVFAVKQPIVTLRKVLLGASQGVYFSHPITEVRRLHTVGENAKVLRFLETYNRHLSMLQEHYIVYEPTAIDDYRFEGLPVRAALPRLSARWPLAREWNPKHDDLIWTAPSNCRSPYAFPGGWEPDNREIPLDETEECSTLLSELIDSIDSQTTTRDYQLIDQSDLTYGFWPLFNGKASGGVEKELRYACLCKNVRLPKEIVICCPVPDRELYRRRVVWEGMIVRWRKTNTLLGDDSQFENLKTRLRAGENELENMITTSDFRGLAELIREAIEELRMRFAEEKNLGPMEPHAMEVRQQQAELCAQEAIRVARTPPYFDGLGARIFAEPPQFPLASP